MTIREALRQELQDQFEGRLELLDNARKAGDERERQRNRGFMTALNEAMRLIDALQDSDTLFIAVYDLLFDAFRLRVKEQEGLAESYDQNGMPENAARSWGTANGYAIAAAILRAKGDRYNAQHAGLE